MPPNVGLSFSAKDLPNLDWMSQSDPFLVLYEVDPLTQKKKLLGMTETVMDNEKNPQFSKIFTTEYRFPIRQIFQIDAYDLDEGSQEDLSKHDFIGTAIFELAQVMSQSSTSLTIQLKDKNEQLVYRGKKNDKPSQIIIKGNQEIISRYKFSFQCTGIDFTKGSFFGKKDDTFIEFCKIRNGDENDLFPIYQSNTCESNQNPVYSGARVGLGDLTGRQDLEGAFVLRALRVKEYGETEVFGQKKIFVNDLFNNQQPNSTNVNDAQNIEYICDRVVMDIFDPANPHKKVGAIRFDGKCKAYHSFLDYLPGLDFNFFVAIDFGSQNGDIEDKKGLHHLHPGGPSGTPTNQYITALRSVGSIVANYCKTQTFPIVGLGANVSIDGSPIGVSNCFPLSLTTTCPSANSIENCVNMYINALSKITPGGPTCWSRAIAAAAQTTLRPYTPDYQHWTIMLLLTPGKVDEPLQRTIDEIVKQSDKPLSIVIIGLGQNDFTDCEQLDSDDKKLISSTGEPAKSDIVQFCSYLQYKDNANAMSQAVLEEIPAQIETFMAGYNIAPIIRDQQPGLQ